jgi:hypothetical protein
VGCVLVGSNNLCIFYVENSYIGLDFRNSVADNIPQNVSSEKVGLSDQYNYLSKLKSVFGKPKNASLKMLFAHLLESINNHLRNGSLRNVK